MGEPEQLEAGLGGEIALRVPLHEPLEARAGSVRRVEVLGLDVGLKEEARRPLEAALRMVVDQLGEERLGLLRLDDGRALPREVHGLRADLAVLGQLAGAQHLAELRQGVRVVALLLERPPEREARGAGQVVQPWPRPFSRAAAFVP